MVTSCQLVASAQRQLLVVDYPSTAELDSIVLLFSDFQTHEDAGHAASSPDRINLMDAGTASDESYFNAGIGIASL
jgi:hypothetical protein